MKGQMQIYYDIEGDFLEINIGKYTRGYFKDVGEGIAERIDEKTGQITGVAILGFRKKTQQMHDVKIDLPIQLEITS